VYALLAGLAWATLDALRRRLAGALDVVALSAWLNGGALVAFVGWMGLAGAGAPGAGYVLPGLGSLGIGLVAQILFLLALRWAGLGATIPMLALTPALSSFLAWLALGELPTTREGLGLALIVGGCLANGLVARRQRGSAAAPHPLRGVLAMAGVALLWSANGVVDKIALQHAHPATHAVLVSLGTAVALVGALWAQGALSRLVPDRADRGPLLGAVGTLGLAYGLQLLALSAIAVGLVEGVKRGLGLPLAVLNGWWFFGESVDVRRLGAVAVVLGGLTQLV